MEIERITTLITADIKVTDKEIYGFITSTINGTTMYGSDFVESLLPQLTARFNVSISGLNDVDIVQFYR